ncbi:MAG: signal peptidase I [Planctomycetota bacterium]
MSGNHPPAETEPGSNASPRDVIISLLIALVVAMLAKTYIIEAFVIPTGSMAPGLLGNHIRFQSEETGYSWAVAPWHYSGRGGTGDPLTVQGRIIDPTTGEVIQRDANPWVHDPMTSSGRESDLGYRSEPVPKELLAGDRVLVDKFVYQFRDPRRYEVAVFKNPTDVPQNFIKRIVGLPGEEVWLVEGDVFVREVDEERAIDEGWRIARKPRSVQEAVWQPIVDAAFTPLPAMDGGEDLDWWREPWGGEKWRREGRRYVLEASDAEMGGWLVLNNRHWPVTDWTAYNDVAGQRHRREIFPVGDVRVRFGVRTPESWSVGVQRLAVSITTKGHEFEARLNELAETGSDAGEWMLRMRTIGGDWEPLGRSETGEIFDGGQFVNVSFEHADQAVRLVVDGKTIVEGGYEWSPVERLRHATGWERDRIMGAAGYRLHEPEQYDAVRPTIAVWVGHEEGEIVRLAVDRDLHYQPVGDRAVQPGRPANLGKGEFFAVGDNSANSEDGRDWRSVDPVITDSFELQPGVVERRLLLGRALMVYFPSPLPGVVPMVDFGRVRAIR